MATQEKPKKPDPAPPGEMNPVIEKPVTDPNTITKAGSFDRKLHPRQIA